MNWEIRKQSEKWVSEKSAEFCKSDSDLTFAEWCYHHGKADGVKKFAENIKSHMMMYCQGRLEQQYCALEVIDYIGKLMGEKDFSIDVEKEMAEHESEIRADERRKFAEWLTKSDYANGYFDTGNGFVSVDKVLAEYEKEQK